MGSLLGLWTSHCDKIGFLQQFVQSMPRFETRKSGRQMLIPDRTAPSSYDAHSSSRAQLCDLLAYAPGADDAYGFVAENDGFVSSVIESMLPLVAIAQVKTTGKVEERSQDVFRHGPLVGQPT